MARNTKLTPESTEKICESIRAGCYDYVACEAAGISQSTFYLWLQQAEEEGADPFILEFSESVRRARAEARSIAERAVFADKPEIWLLKGPGRERPGRDGWASENTFNVKSSGGPIVLTWGDNENNDAAIASGATDS